MFTNNRYRPQFNLIFQLLVHFIRDIAVGLQTINTHENKSQKNKYKDTYNDTFDKECH